jgi:hypothetical protein
MDKSPAHFKVALETTKKITSQKQKTFDRGNAFDALILRGGFEELVAVEPDLHKNTKKYK